MAYARKEHATEWDMEVFWCDTPEGIPAHFFNPEFPDKQWGDIKVPSNWEMQGYGDKLFRNVSAPFGVNPPHAPKEYNPTGLYRRTFKVPASLGSKRPDIF